MNDSSLEISVQRTIQTKAHVSQNMPPWGVRAVIARLDEFHFSRQKRGMNIVDSKTLPFLFQRFLNATTSNSLLSADVGSIPSPWLTRAVDVVLNGGLIDALNVYCMRKLIPKFYFSDVFCGLNNGTAKFQKNVIRAVFDGLGIISRIVLSYELHDIVFQPLPCCAFKGKCCRAVCLLFYQWLDLCAF